MTVTFHRNDNVAMKYTSGEDKEPKMRMSLWETDMFLNINKQILLLASVSCLVLHVYDVAMTKYNIV